MTPRPPINEDDFDDEDDGKPLDFRMGCGVKEEPYNFEDFKDEIDPWSGYLNTIAHKAKDVKDDLELGLKEDRQYVFRPLQATTQPTHLRKKNIVKLYPKRGV